MRHSAFSDEERERLLTCLRELHPLPHSDPTSEVIDSVVQAYGDLDVSIICALISAYTRNHADELKRLLARQEHDRRRLSLLSDPALPGVLERLEHDRYALRRSWAERHEPRDLQRLADLWGVRLGP